MRIAPILLIVPLLLVSHAAAADSLEQTQKRGAALEAQGRWEEADAAYRSALDLLGPNAAPQDRFWLLTSLAEIAYERREYQGTARHLREAEEAIRSLGPDAPERVRLLNAWGTLHLVEGNLTAAERDLSRAVTLAKAPADRAGALHNLAAVEMQMGRLELATGHETQAIALWSEELGDRHHYVMRAWISLSSLQGLRADWRGAEQSLQKALAIAETQEALSNYAVVLDRLKRGREARDIRRRLTIQMAAPPPVADVRAMRYEGTAIRAR